MLLPILFACLGLHQADVVNRGYYMQPSLRGDTLVFVSQGDLWKVSASGGLAQPLTSHVAPASNPALSPDGKAVAFTGTYEGPADAYVMPLDGDLPKRLTYDGGMTVVGWAPGGKVLASTRIEATLPSPQLVAIDAATKRKTDVPLTDVSQGCYDDTGKTIYFTRYAFQGSHTMRYQGGTAQSVWKYQDGAEEAVPLTKGYTGTSKNPMVWNHKVYFLTDRDGWMNVWLMDESGGSLKQVTHVNGWDIQSASIDAGRIAYQAGADLHVLDLASGSDKTLDIRLSSDFDQSRERWINNPMSYMTAIDPSPDGEKIALTARGQVFVAPAEGGRFIEVTHKPGVRYRNAIFTQDGKSVLVLSDLTGETEWWRFPANGVGAPEQLTNGTKVLIVSGKLSPDGKHLAYADKNQDLWMLDMTTKKVIKVDASAYGDISDPSWSPDSQWLSYTKPTVSFDRIMLYSMKDGKSLPVTTERSDSESSAWSPDGKWLYFLSNRTFRSSVSSPWGPREPEPFFDKQTKIYMIGLTKGQRSPFQPSDELTTPALPAKPSSVTVAIDLDGIQQRLWEVPVPAGNYQLLRTNGPKLFVYAGNSGGGSDLDSVDVANKDVHLTPVAPDIQGYELSRDGKKFVFFRAGGLFTMSAAGGPPTRVDLSAWSFPIQPRDEWRQMLTEAWRLERDYFYAPNLLSVDWNGVLKKYLPLVDRVRDRSELSNVLGQMIGELSTLHMFVYGGDERAPQSAVFTSYLGGELTRTEADGGYKVKSIYQGEPDYPNSMAPLARPGVDIAVGDVITAVNGVETLSVPEMSSLLRNKEGRQVLLRVKDGKTNVSRDVIVTPIGANQFADLRYTDWEVSRRQLVDKASNGTIGYVHLRAMGSGDIAQWERDFYPVFDRPGLIIDVRHNNGGNIDSWIIEKLLRKAWFYWQPRVGAPSWNMQWAFRGHVAVLCDAHTASDGEAFTEGIKRLGLGKVFGTRTWGGEVWLSSDNVLLDNGIATAAETGVYGPEGKWLIEGHGVEPDVVVDDPPHATYLGKDAQLDAAIAYLTKEIHDKPVPVPPAPPYSNKNFPVKKGG